MGLKSKILGYSVAILIVLIIVSVIIPSAFLGVVWVVTELFSFEEHHARMIAIVSICLTGMVICNFPTGKE